MAHGFAKAPAATLSKPKSLRQASYAVMFDFRAVWYVREGVHTYVSAENGSDAAKAVLASAS